MAVAVREPSLLARDQDFENLYRRYVKDVYHYALALLRNPADAEDVTQTTFMNAYRAYQRGEEVLKPQNWLIKIAHNVARTRYARASRRVKEVPLEDHVEMLAVPEEERPNIEAVLQALGRLPFNQRAAIVMRELEGRSYAEIADTLGVSVPAVETLIFRARRSLRLRASALRSLTAVPLPTSLAPLVEGGSVVAGGGAIAGTGFLAKAAVALVAGAVATGFSGDKNRTATAAGSSAALGGAPASAAAQGVVVNAKQSAKKGRALIEDGSLAAQPRAGDAGAVGASAGGVPGDAAALTLPAAQVITAAGGIPEAVEQAAEAAAQAVAGALPVAAPSPPALPVESPSVPTVSVTSPSLPSVPLASPSLPSVPLATPSLSTVPVQAPSLPGVPVPAPSVPSVPVVPLPAPPLPKLP